MRHLSLVVAALLSLFLCACSREAALQKIASPEDQAIARSAVADIASGRAGALSAKLVPPLVPTIGAALPQMRAMLPVGKLRLVDARFFTNVTAGTRFTNMLWEASDGRRFALVSTTIYRRGAEARVSELYVVPMKASADTLSRFDLVGKSFVQYLFLVLAIAALLLCLTGIFVALRLPGLRHRWLWAIGSLVGICQFSVRWSDGNIFFQPINIQLFGAFAVKPALLVPWQVGFGIPVVAIILLVKRFRYRRTLKEAFA
ncbi:MAG TPA: hypothetical protein VGC56_00185 [Allosphingosinicella sp.]|jgi:hypothetical protein